MSPILGAAAAELADVVQCIWEVDRLDLLDPLRSRLPVVLIAPVEVGDEFRILD